MHGLTFSDSRVFSFAGAFSAVAASVVFSPRLRKRWREKLCLWKLVSRCAFSKWFVQFIFAGALRSTVPHRALLPLSVQRKRLSYSAFGIGLSGAKGKLPQYKP